MNKWWILPSSSNLSLHYSLVFKTSFKLIRYKSRFRTMGSKAVANFILWQKKSLLFWCFIFHTYIRQILMVFLWKSHLLPTVLPTHSDIFQESDLIARLYSPMSRLLSFIHVVGWKITQRQIFAPKPMDFERRELGTTSHKFQISCRKLSHLSSLMKRELFTSKLLTIPTIYNKKAHEFQNFSVWLNFIVCFISVTIYLKTLHLSMCPLSKR